MCTSIVPPPASVDMKGLDHRHGESGGHGGVDGIAPTLEDARADLGAQRMLGHHHAPGRERRTLRHGEEERIMRPPC